MTDSDFSDALRKIDIGTTARWRAAGLSARQLHSLTVSGHLVKIRRGVYATSNVMARAETDPGLRHALYVVAVTDTRTGKGVASHHSAAQLLGLNLLNPQSPGTVMLTVPPGTRVSYYARTGVVCHMAELPSEHLTTLYGVPATTAARTVVDIARTASFMEGVVVTDSALYERHTSKTELRRVLLRCDRWPGISRSRRVVEFATGLAESVLESCARVVFREQGLPAPELQVHISGRDRTVIARVDFFWRRYNVIAESDGLLKYDGGERAIAELKRDRLLREEGYEVVHFTWQELFSDPVRVAGRIRAAFERASRLSRRGLRFAGGAVGRDGLHLVPAGVLLDRGLVAGFQQVDEVGVLGDGGFEAFGQVREHRGADPVQPQVRLLEQFEKVGVAAPGDDRGVQSAVQPAELDRVPVRGGHCLHLGGDLPQPAQVRQPQVGGGVGGGGALQDRHGDHLLLPGGRVDRRHDRAHVRLEAHPAFGFEPAQRLPHRDGADAEFTREAVDVQPGPGSERAGVDPVPQDRVCPLLFVHIIRA